MSDSTKDLDVVGTLRLKTEEIDMDQYLKSRLGGYTKKSVLEYLSILRKQQQVTADTFYNNLQTVYDEKEELTKINKSLQYELNKIKMEYKNLSESMTEIKLEDSDFTAQDIITLQNANSALEENAKKIGFEKESLENEIIRLKNSINELEVQLKQSKSEIMAANEIVSTKKQETKELRDKMIELTINVESKEEEIKHLKASQEEGQIVKLRTDIQSLTNQIMTQTEVNASLNSQINTKIQTIDVLTEETELQKQMLDDLKRTVEDFQYKNKKLLYANNVFTNQLQEVHTRFIELINEKSFVTVEKIDFQRKLDEASSKIAMLEMKLNKKAVIGEMKELQEIEERKASEVQES
jgi:chromosome segregation ATPase